MQFLVRVCLEHRNGEMSITNGWALVAVAGGSCIGTSPAGLVTGSCE